MRRILGAALLLAPAPAFAGGFGILGTGGLHTEQVFFYSSTSTINGQNYNNLQDYEQFRVNQFIPHVGGGLEFLLGDARDDKIIGTIRVYYNADFGQTDPASQIDGAVVATNDASNPGQLREESVVGAFRSGVRNLGFAMVGLSWGIAGDPNKFQLSAVGHVGTALVTLDHTEFFMAQLGPGITYR
ncbi:MAG: hypothetical protein AAF211_05545, partial [Myxococcota bacterium]